MDVCKKLELNLLNHDTFLPDMRKTCTFCHRYGEAILIKGQFFVCYMSSYGQAIQSHEKICPNFASYGHVWQIDAKL